MSTHLARALYAAVQSPLLVALAASLLTWLLLSSAQLREGSSRALQRHAAPALLYLSAGILAVYATLLGWYLWIPNFAGEVEPTVTSVSWVATHGLPLYHGMETAARYSVLYGPAIFLINGWLMQLLGPSVASAKVAGVLAGASSMLFLYWSLRGLLSRRNALGLCALSVLLYFIHGPFSYLSRPDPLLLSAAAFGLFAATRLGRWPAAIGVAAAIALCINMKIHGIVYLLLPLVVLHDRHGSRVLGSTLLGAGLVSLTPFALSNVSLGNYLQWLGQATRHGLDRETFLHTLRFAVLLLLPLAILAPRASRSVAQRHSATLLISYAMTLVFAAKPGAGLNHLLPLVPSTIYILAQQLNALAVDGWSSMRKLGRLRHAALLGTLATTIFVGCVAEAKCVQRLHAGSQIGTRIVGDLHSILERYPQRTIAMAYGGEGADYELTFYRPLLLFAGQPLPLDIISLMDSQKAQNALPTKTYEALSTGVVDLWLVPRGASPFVKRNWYPPHQNVFPEDFVDLLQSHYRNRESTEFYDLWFYEAGIPAFPASAVLDDTQR